MQGRRILFLRFFPLLGLLVVSEVLLSAQLDQNATWPATLIESAWGLEEDGSLLFTGIEFEEDSGDFPTTKIGFHLMHGLTRELMLEASSQLVRFNSGDYTAWGGAESTLGVQMGLRENRGGAPAIQLKGQLFGPRAE